MSGQRDAVAGQAEAQRYELNAASGVYGAGCRGVDAAVGISIAHGPDKPGLPGIHVLVFVRQQLTHSPLPATVCCPRSM